MSAARRSWPRRCGRATSRPRWTASFGPRRRSSIERDAIVDKFVGDEVVAIFHPGSDRRATRRERRSLLVRPSWPQAVTGRTVPHLPIGIGVHTGIAFVGSIGVDANVDLTAMGDPVNAAARLASAAGPNEALVTLEAAHAGDLDVSGLEQRDLELKGKSARTSVVVLRAPSA